ncbi:MAG: glycosyltransferase family 2 protein [Desulfamplus sp.]|nr:glycosyltransferase family 2 protein [Desulfamplus sp.]
MIPELSVVVPVFNEARGLPDMIRELTQIAKGLAVSFEIVLVDDGSRDETWQVIQFLSSSYPELMPVRLIRNFGKEAALTAGLKASRGKAVVVMDADLQHPPSLIPEMYRLWKTGVAQVVNGVKARRQEEGKIHRAAAAGFYLMMNLMSGVDLKNHTDFKLMDRQVVDAYLAIPENRRFFRGLIPWLGFLSRDLHFVPNNRETGTSRWSVPGLARMGIMAICSFSSLPLQAVTLLGIFFLLASLVMGIHTLVLKFTGQAVEGFATVILLLLFMGSVLMFSLGIIGQYIAMIYHEVKRRPMYLVSSRDDKSPTPTGAKNHSIR